MEKKEEDKSVAEKTAIVSGALELKKKLHLLGFIQQLQLYTLICHLKLQLTNIYLDLKGIKITSTKDSFNNWIADLSILNKQKKHRKSSNNLFYLIENILKELNQRLTKKFINGVDHPLPSKINKNKLTSTSDLPNECADIWKIWPAKTGHIIYLQMMLLMM